MKLTPLDIKKQEFKRTMRGYDPVEVDTFMDMMANEFEDLLRQQKESRDKTIEMETQLKDYKQIEKTLQQTLLQAQETTGKTYETARRDAESIIKEAELRAAKIVEEANVRLTKLHSELDQLIGRKEALVGRLRVLLSSELDLIKALEIGRDPVLESNTSHGTGKENIELDNVLKTIDNDNTSQAD